MDFILEILDSNKTSLIVSVFALIVSYVTYNYNKKRNEKERAVALAKEFINIINVFSIVKGIISLHPDIWALINRRGTRIIDSNFTLEEAMSIYNENEIEKLKEFFIKGKINYKIIYDVLEATGKDVPKFRLCKVNSQKRILIMKFADMCSDILNTLEYFSMNFIQKLAKRDIIYQPVHYMFFEMMDILYIKIALNNRTENDKYFSHAIQLYNLWAKKDKEK